MFPSIERPLFTINYWCILVDECARRVSINTLMPWRWQLSPKNLKIDVYRMISIEIDRRHFDWLRTNPLFLIHSIWEIRIIAARGESISLPAADSSQSWDSFCQMQLRIFVQIFCLSWFRKDRSFRENSTTRRANDEFVDIYLGSIWSCNWQMERRHATDRCIFKAFLFAYERNDSDVTRSQERKSLFHDEINWILEKIREVKGRVYA